MVHEEEVLVVRVQDIQELVVMVEPAVEVTVVLIMEAVLQEQ